MLCECEFHVNASSDISVKSIINWYMERSDDYKDDATDFKITHFKYRIFHVTFKLLENDAIQNIYGSLEKYGEFVAEQLANPDEDGNYPLYDQDKKEQLISAEVEKFKFKETKPSKPQKKRCPKGTKKNKQGECVAKTQSKNTKKSPANTTKKRCPNGYHKNKKTGICEKK